MNHPPQLLRRTLFLAVALSTVALLPACSSTSLVNMWKDPANPPRPLQSVLVVSLQQSATSRRIWEDGFVKSLQEEGVEAVPSYTLFPGNAPDTTALVAIVRQRGFQGMVLAHRLGVDTVRSLRPGYVTNEPVTLISPWTGAYYTYWTDVYRPGYVEREEVVRYETEVWSTGGRGRLVWTGITESLSPSSASSITREIADRIVPELVKQRVVGK